MLNIVYLIWLINKVIFMSTKSFNVNYYVDLTRREVAIFIIFIFSILYFGIFPNILINFII
jgi:NADH:ubiquinone oxidoreductase subunit 4 (subunit M)